MEDQLQQLFLSAIQHIHPEFSGEIEFSVPQNKDHGDLATNIALQLAKPMKKTPRSIAEEITARLKSNNHIDWLQSVEIAGPGFINIKFSQKQYSNTIREIVRAGTSYGSSQKHLGKTVNLEWVSANPTGNLHAGHGRQVCLGLAVANLLEWIGYSVVREYYFNNAGNQMKNLAISTRVRYLQELGEQVELPEDGYHGEEIVEIAKEIVTQHGENYRGAELTQFQKFAEEENFRRIKHTLTRLGVKHDIFFNEQSLYDSGAVARLIALLQEKGLAYKQDGAIWLKLSAMGMEQDRVIVKSSGEPTYRLPDIAYHSDKLSRGYDHIIDIFGADHIATIPDVLVALKALGYDEDKVTVIIHQMVSFVSSGELIKFSKRTGGNYLLDDLIDDVGSDASKFFFNMRAVGSHLEFDVELAKDQSEKNPVYYVQYAHARIASILRFANDQEIDTSNLANADLDVLTHSSEHDLVKLLSQFPSLSFRAAEAHAPHHICEYLRQVAAGFHKFYHDCRIVGQPEPLQSARLALAQSAKYVLGAGCALLGVSAPESM
ncbi:MAG TPA: arginine--tRNA ligase [Candidatus Kapabacteria bacterium]|nr:arginine--tRNA ligase [Candidatus Kapabacteria bacterium]